MKKKLSVVLCITLIISLVPMTSAFAAKKIKTKSVSVAPKAMTLAVGDVAQLTASKSPTKSTDKLTWTSSDKSVATVSGKGLVSGVAPGTAKITVKTTSKKTATCVVTVKQYITADEVSDSIIDKVIDKIKGLFATKDDVTDAIKQNTYTKSEIDAKISAAGSGSTSGACACKKIEKASDIAVFPAGKVEYKNAEVIITPDEEEEESRREITDITVDKIAVKSYTQNSYDDFLQMDSNQRHAKYGDTRDVYMRYAINIEAAGSVDSKYAGYIVQLEFNTNTEDGSNFKSIFVTVGNDGSFSGTGSIHANELPRELVMCYINVWNKLNSD